MLATITFDDGHKSTIEVLKHEAKHKECIANDIKELLNSSGMIYKVVKVRVH